MKRSYLGIGIIIGKTKCIKNDRYEIQFQAGKFTQN